MLKKNRISLTLVLLPKNKDGKIRGNKKQSPKSDERLRSKIRVLFGEPPNENATIRQF
ncbi:MAG: hypothetical protein K0R57_1765 [Paenibacillaceae bacterium]|nr:hypothetical protein [Paenibacillaceae bacterium]